MVKGNKIGFKRQAIIQLILLISILLLINILSSALYKRFDLTTEKRYSLTPASKELLKNLNDVVYVQVYLEGEFPAGFKRLRNSTKDLLDEFRALVGTKLEYEFINPNISGNPKEREELYKQLARKGLSATNLQVQGDDNYSEKIIFPGAIVIYQGREIPVHLLQSQSGMNPQEVLNNSIGLLEYKFTNAIYRATLIKKTKIGFIEGHGELNPKEVESFTNTLKDAYEIERIVLPENPYISKTFDAVIIAKPRNIFTEPEKFKIDQFIMNGGKVIFLIDPLSAEMDSLRNKAFIPSDLPLNLEDILFKYGVRINNNLIQDLQCNPIPIIVGSMGDAPQTDFRPWIYFPVITSTSSHPIAKNLDAVMTRFVSSIDTVGARSIKKTILLASSQYSRTQFSPVRVTLSSAQFKPKPEQFNKPFQPIAVLLEGKFESVFKNRLPAETMTVLDSLNIKFKEEGVSSKILVISDGDFIKNDIDKSGNPYPLGFYKFTQQTFANKDFLMNALEYMCENNGLIAARTKEIKLRLLDTARIKSERLKWQLINLVFPLITILFFAFIYNIIRKRKYSKIN